MTSSTTQRNQSWDLDLPPDSEAGAFVGQRIRWQFVAGSGIAIGAMLLTPLLVGLVALPAGVAFDIEVLMSGYQGIPPWAVLVGRVLVAVLALGTFLLIVDRLGRVPGVGFVAPRSQGTTSISAGLVRLSGGFLLGTAVLVLVIAGMAWLGGASLRPGGLEAVVLVAVASGLAAGVWEEVFYRGILQRLLHGWMGWWQAYLLMIVVFGISHYDGDVWKTMAITLQAGTLLGAIWLATRRLWVSIGYHVAWNSMQDVLFSTDVGGGLWRLERHEQGLITGGASGIEASIITTLACLTLSAAFLYVAHRRGFLRPLDTTPGSALQALTKRARQHG